MALRRGNQAFVSEAIPLTRSTFFAYLSTFKSLREAAAQMSLDTGRKIAHQSIMDVLDRDQEYQQTLNESERVFAMNWPKSATDGGYLPYQCMHNSFRKDLDEVLFRHRFRGGWPSFKELGDLFISCYDKDRWEKKTPHKELLRSSGIPVKMRSKVLDYMRKQLKK